MKTPQTFGIKDCTIFLKGKKKVIKTSKDEILLNLDFIAFSGSVGCIKKKQFNHIKYSAT